MLDSLLNATTVPLLEQLAKFNERRQEVLAGNVANIDTPHYKRRDLDQAAFKEALSKAIDSRKVTPATRYAPPPKSLAEHFDRSLFDAVDPDPKNLTFQDGAERSIESEITELTRNSMMQTFAIETMAAQMRVLEAVITETP